MSQWSLPPYLINLVFYTQGPSNQLHVFNMLQSTSQMATVQDFGHWRMTGTSSHTRNPILRIIEDSSQPITYHLLRTSTAQITTYEELCTLLVEIEACLNSRPLCALSDDPFNPTYLSPGHFLIGEPITQLPATDLTNVKCNRLSRW